MERVRVIIAEKDRVLRKNLREMLTRAGYVVIGEEEDGMSALKMIRTVQPEIVLVSTGLPVMSGVELAKIIEDGRLAAVVLMMDYAEKDMVCRAGERWSIPVLVKPFDEFHLYSMVEYSYATYSKILGLESEVNRLKDDLETRKIVEKAKGILMKTQNLLEEQAFTKMQQLSMKKRVSMKSIAQAVITSHEISKSG